MRWTAVLLVCLAGTAPAQEPSAKGINFYSLDRERQLGQSLAANLDRSLPIVHEAKLDAYVGQLGAALAKYANSPFPFTFTLYEDRKPDSAYGGPSVVGTAMPVGAFQGQAGEPVSVAGRPIFIPMSLIAAAPDEAVLAFQLTHAMVHIACRHATNGATRTELMQISDSGGRAIPLGMLTFARANEREADYFAVQILMKTGYDPEAMASYLPERATGSPAGSGFQGLLAACPQ